MSEEDNKKYTEEEIDELIRENKELKRKLRVFNKFLEKRQLAMTTLLESWDDHTQILESKMGE